MQNFASRHAPNRRDPCAAPLDSVRRLSRRSDRVCCVGGAAAQAQAWPTRSVRFILTLGPGSGTDIGARLLSDRLARKWSQSVVIENKPGGDSIVGIAAFVGAKDDHILLMSPTSAFTAHPFLHDNLPYKPEDLAPIARVSNTLSASPCRSPRRPIR